MSSYCLHTASSVFGAEIRRVRFSMAVSGLAMPPQGDMVPPKTLLHLISRKLGARKLFITLNSCVADPVTSAI